MNKKEGERKGAKKKRTVVPEVTVKSLAVLNTLNALKIPTCRPPPPRSTPPSANAKLTQKHKIATASIRLHECLKYGTFRLVIPTDPLTLKRKGRERALGLCGVEEAGWSERRRLWWWGWEAVRRWEGKEGREARDWD